MKLVSGGIVGDVKLWMRLCLRLEASMDSMETKRRSGWARKEEEGGIYIKTVRRDVMETWMVDRADHDRC